MHEWYLFRKSKRKSKQKENNSYRDAQVVFITKVKKEKIKKYSIKFTH